MNFKILKKIIEENNISEDVHLMSDSGWECSPTEMNGMYYDSERNEITITQQIYKSDVEKLEKRGYKILTDIISCDIMSITQLEEKYK